MGRKKHTIAIEEKLNSIADKWGYCHSNKFYRDKVEEVYGIKITATQVTAIMGSQPTRLLTHFHNYDAMTQRFIDQLGGDVRLAIRLVRNYQRQQKSGIRPQSGLGVPVSDR